MIIRKATEKDLVQILDIFNCEILNTQYVYIYEPWTMQQPAANDWLPKCHRAGDLRCETSLV